MAQRICESGTSLTTFAAADHPHLPSLVGCGRRTTAPPIRPPPDRQSPKLAQRVLWDVADVLCMPAAGTRSASGGAEPAGAGVPRCGSRRQVSVDAARLRARPVCAGALLQGRVTHDCNDRRHSTTGHVVTVFGATSFLGRYLVSKLGAYRTDIAVSVRKMSDGLLDGPQPRREHRSSCRTGRRTRRGT